MLRLIRRILSISGKYKARIRTAYLFSFLKAICAKASIGFAFVLLVAFLEGKADADLCLWIGIGAAVSVILQMAFQHLVNMLQSAAGYMIFADKRMELGAHLQKMPMGYFAEGNIGKISSVLSTDMLFIEENCMNSLGDMISYIFTGIILVGFLFYLNPWLGLTATGILLLVLLVAKGMNRDSLKHSSVRQEQSENLTEAVLDFVEGIGIIKTYNLLGEKSKELSDNFRESCRKNIAFEENAAVWQRRLNLLYGMGAVLVLGVSLYLYSSGRMEAAFLVGILLFVLDLFAPVKALYNDSARLTVMSSCMDRIEEVFAEAELPDVGKSRIPAATGEPEVSFRHVSFGYGEKEVLRDISFDLQKNSMMALVGPSGGGKSTIASLLARFWDVKSGQVLVRGTDIREVPLGELMHHISMVFQRVYLFQDTIYNNISMGRPDATEAEVVDAAKKARCYDFIMALPEGFQTVVGEGGETLSGGEKQRISIARCILKDAPVVILDEATASVDADNESYIQQAISELCRGKTLLVIAHRLGTIRNANRILVIANGQIRQEGTHDELMRAGGMYRDFVTVRENSRGWSRSSSIT